MKIALVIRDADGDAWIRVGSDLYAMVRDVASGPAYVSQWGITRTELETHGPLKVEHSMEAE